MSDPRYPLHYPIGWERTKHRKRSRFNPRGTRTFAQARDAVFKELRLLGAKNVVLSTNIPLRQDGLPYAKFTQPLDPGAAVYFSLDQQPVTLACDCWDRVIDNIWAIAKHIESMRGQQTWGVGTLAQAFKGYGGQLPPGSGEVTVEPQWWDVLGVQPDASMPVIQAAYRALARKNHPDAGGDTEAFVRLGKALEAAKQREDSSE